MAALGFHFIKGERDPFLRQSMGSERPLCFPVERWGGGSVTIKGGH